MRFTSRAVAAAVALALLLGFMPRALADWDVGDPYKMHFPQLPDPNGWDVKVTPPVLLADDWLCTQSGTVDDIHFWGSWQQGIVGQVSSLWVGIYANIPAGPLPGEFSRPGPLLWEEVLTPIIRPIDPPAEQGWFDPSTGQFNRPDHTNYFQFNLVDIPNPFVQQQGQIYWLGIQATVIGGGVDFGWKTSLNHFEDDAVWAFVPVAPGPVGIEWNELRDPLTAESLDLAFVITTIPEPGSLMLGAVGGLLLLRRRR